MMQLGAHRQLKRLPGSTMKSNITYFWIAEFGDECLPQFDPESGKENMYSIVMNRIDELTAIGWYPVTEKLCDIVTDDIVVPPTSAKPIRITCKPGEGNRVRILRRNLIHYGIIHNIETRDIVFVIGIMDIIDNPLVGNWFFIYRDGRVATDNNMTAI